MELSITQKIIKLFVSKSTFAEMEAESKLWIVKCPNCKQERSIWSMGGIRYKAYGEKRLYRHCINCGQRNWLKVYKKDATA